ncbi:uncharacterized protein MONBRDRAFT_24376 [Monosiga brevicollis MX1]|uniref:Uncharacterized protein n=1 Tax=Monosiga brevicollis TaxID=81824 RepID=A9UW84_MONBE|nr:uncharacterized protein MONBRDRAFT_24376 [Monosiga brevicollis MX1]EDQ90721.1 predicted protein [Monosiga brevicollis MX1]|eukprot:XP_001744772.1 hypothetical protein [Monosiga brevicollis MX1]
MWTRLTAILLVAVVALATARPFESRDANLLHDLAPTATNGSCLTPQQDKELKEAITGIHITLTATVTALDIAAAAESNPDTKQSLELAAKIIDAVNIDLVNNLTAIVDSSCGTCSQIAQVVNMTVISIEETLNRIEPNWRNDTVYKVIVQAVNDILAIVETVCPDSALRLRLGDNNQCLNASQVRVLEQVVTGIQIVLTAAEMGLEVAESAETDPATKQKLAEAVRDMKIISHDLIANLTTIAESNCSTCSAIVATVDEAIVIIENTLTDIDPDWRNDQLFQAIFQGIQQILGYVTDLCPSSVGRLLEKHRLSLAAAARAGQH